MRTIPAFYFDALSLRQRAAAEGWAERFRDAWPFPHLVVDDLLPDEVLQLLVSEFPSTEDIPWQAGGTGRSNAIGNKLGQSDETLFPPFIRHFMGQLLSSTLVSVLEEVSQLGPLIVDPSHNGCGLHSTGPGGRLMIHTDSNRYPHSTIGLHQILNLIIYLNPRWRDDYGGHLELWSTEREPVARILPVANRAVLFKTGAQSYHGHPAPLTCPSDRRRNSIAVYYYCFDREPSVDYPGMQLSPHWIATSEADRSRARESARLARQLTLRLAGRNFLIQSMSLPAPVKDLDRDGTVGLTIADASLPWGADADQPGLTHRVASVRTDSDPSDELYLVGYLHRSDDVDGRASTRSVLLLCSDRDGALYLENRLTGYAVFWGYLDKIAKGWV